MKYFLDTEFHEYQRKISLFGLNLTTPTDTIELISIGIVCEDGREYYDVCNEFDVKRAWQNEWLRENVLRPIFYELFSKLPTYAKNYHSDSINFNPKGLRFLLDRYGKKRSWIKDEILEFCSPEIERYSEHGAYHLPKPEFYGYYADYDWVAFCWLFGRMIDLPKGFPMYCRDLKQMLDEKAGDDFPVEAFKLDINYPKQENEHNALADAKWNKKLFDFIQGI